MEPPSCVSVSLCCNSLDLAVEGLSVDDAEVWLGKHVFIGNRSEGDYGEADAY